MKQVIQIIIGSIARHWLSSLFGILIAQHYITKEVADSAAGSLTNEWVYNFIMASVAALLPAFMGIYSHLFTLLKTKLGLLMAKGTTQQEVSARMKEAPVSTQIAATLTSDPEKILDSK